MTVQDARFRVRQSRQRSASDCGDDDDDDHGNTATSTSGDESDATPFTLKEIKAAIPAKCFVKHAGVSLMYMARDLMAWLATVTVMTMLSRTAWWQTAPTWQWLPLAVLYWNVCGFIMWCTFVVGHDCGHRSFSNSPTLNAVCGHLCHTPLLVPFWCWSSSHQQHHLHHNHKLLDFSFPWWTKEDVHTPQARVAHGIRLTFPFTGFILYLSGLPDGGHWIPSGRLVVNASTKVWCKYITSSSAVLLFAYAGASIMAWNWARIFLLYGGCWLMFSFWLVTVTYLQHHDEDSLVFDDHTWSYLKGAFQTIDREYGFPFDSLHHHITDCHLVHHLFFTKIPHYHLPEATAALRQFLQSRGLLHMHRRKRQHDFFLEVFRSLWSFSFVAHEPTKRAATSS